MTDRALRLTNMPSIIPYSYHVRLIDSLNAIAARGWGSPCAELSPGDACNAAAKVTVSLTRAILGY